MKFTNDGLTLVYDTAEAPAPQGSIARKNDISVTAMLGPACPSNIVTIDYRVDGRLREPLRANAGEIHHGEGAQFYRAAFPSLKTGEVVHYAVVGSCAGRRVPGLDVTRELPHSFRVEEPREAVNAHAGVDQDNPPRAIEPSRFQVDNEFLARVTIAIESQRVIGPTPEGIRVTWNAKKGSIVGPKLRASLLQGADWMCIRSDGIGDIDVRAVIETEDGAKIMSSYTGVLEWGEDGYQRFLSNDLPKPLKARTAQRFLTADPKYSWLNRLQSIGIGEVLLDQQSYTYDAYVLR